MTQTIVTTFYAGTIPGSNAAADVDVDVLTERYLSAVVEGMRTGATVHRARGAWQAPGGLVVEDSIVIETIETVDDNERDAHRARALDTARKLCKIGAQQEVYVTQRELDDLIIGML